MATSPVTLSAAGPLVRGAVVDDLADVGVWRARLDGVDVLVQEVGDDAEATRAGLESIGSWFGWDAHPVLMAADGAQLVAMPFAEGEWLSELLDARRRLPVMPPRAVLAVGQRLAEALERSWGPGEAPPAVRPDVRSVAIRLGKDGIFRFGALRFAGRLPRDAGDGRGPATADDTRGEDLYLLGSMLFEMATRRRFGRGGTTMMIQRHHVQRRLTAASAELDGFGERRTEFVDLLLSLLGAERDVNHPFAAVSAACRELLARVDGDGLAEWTAVVFPEPVAPEEPEEEPEVPLPVVAPAAARPGIVGRGAGNDEFTPIMLDPSAPGEEPTDLGTAEPPEVEDATETSEEAGAGLTPPMPVKFPRPAPLKLPPPSFGGGVAESPGDSAEEPLPENVIPLRDVRPGRRRGGLVPKGLDTLEPLAAPAPRASPARPADAVTTSRRARPRPGAGLIVGIGVVALVPLFALAGAWWALTHRGQAEPDALALAPSSALPEPPSSAVVPDPTPAPPPVAAPAPVVADPVVPAAAKAPPKVPALAPAKPPPAPTKTTSPPIPPALATPPPLPAGSPWAAPVAAVGPIMATFNSTPGGVLVTIDGAPRGTTPIQVVLTPGSHSLSYETDGRVYARDILVDPAGKNTWKLNSALGKIE